jgi:hypothetical protein
MEICTPLAPEVETTNDDRMGLARSEITGAIEAPVALR